MWLGGGEHSAHMQATQHVVSSSITQLQHGFGSSPPITIPQAVAGKPQAEARSSAPRLNMRKLNAALIGSRGGNAHNNRVTRQVSGDRWGASCSLSLDTRGRGGGPGGLRPPIPRKSSHDAAPSDGVAPKVSRHGHTSDEDVQACENRLKRSKNDGVPQGETWTTADAGQRKRQRTQRNERESGKSHKKRKKMQKMQTISRAKEDGMSIREAARKATRQHKRATKKKSQRKRQIVMQQRQTETERAVPTTHKRKRKPKPPPEMDPPKRRRVHQRIRFGTWNTRGLGAPYSTYDQGIKHAKMFGLAEQKEWAAMFLTDVKYGTNGVRSYESETQTWTIITHGLVAIALNAGLAHRWRQGGAKTWLGPQNQLNPARVLAVNIPTEGWRRGYQLVVAYAHTGKNATARARGDIRDSVIRGMDKATDREIVVVGGDWNTQIALY
jgi:hypothetical protein